MGRWDSGRLDSFGSSLLGSRSLGLGVGPPVAAFGLWAAEMLPDQLGTELASSSVLILLQANRSFQWQSDLNGPFGL